MLYFAFGMNLDPATMSYFNARPVCPATLENWKLVFRHYADVERCPGASVPGALWEIDDACLRGLDGREGYPHHYDREEVTVTTADGPATALVYFMARQDEGYYPPGPGYLDMIKTGYDLWQLDKDALAASLHACGYVERVTEPGGFAYDPA